MLEEWLGLEEGMKAGTVVGSNVSEEPPPVGFEDIGWHEMGSLCQTSYNEAHYFNTAD